jgi:diguanylate cyclase (GGDEF)-like protein
LARGRALPFLPRTWPLFTGLRDGLAAAAARAREDSFCQNALRQEAADMAARHALWDRSSNALILELDARLQPRAASHACRHMLGGAIHVDSEYDDAWRDLLAAARDGLSPPPAAMRVRRPDHGTIWLEIAVWPDGCGGVIVRAHDISLLRDTQARLAQAQAQLATLALEDPLTGLANRRCFDEALRQEALRTLRQDALLAVLVIAPADFAIYRSHHGALQADACLRRIARAMAAALKRPGDLAGRIGTAEFAVLLPATGELGASIVAERLRRAVRALHIGNALAEAGVVTVTAGVACLRPGSPQPAEALLAEARAAMRPAMAPAAREDYSVASGASDSINSNTLLRTAGPVMR